MFQIGLFKFQFALISIIQKININTYKAYLYFTSDVYRTYCNVDKSAFRMIINHSTLDTITLDG